MGQKSVELMGNSRFKVELMKNIGLLSLVLFGSCIQTELEPALTENLRTLKLGDTEFIVNGTYELEAAFTNSDGILDTLGPELQWTSSDPAILSFSGNEATALQDGEVSISVQMEELMDTDTIVIKPSQESITISSARKLQTGSSFKFKVNYTDISGDVKEVTPEWESSDESIATVSPEGLVHGLAGGITQITASFGNVTDQVSLEVTDTLVTGEDPKIQLTRFDEFLEVNETFTFVAFYIGTDGQVDESVALQWMSSDTDILTIDQSGNATALSVGMATITVSFGTVTTMLVVEVQSSSAATKRTGTLMGTGYSISGTFSLEENPSGDLILKVTNYRPDGPGPYFYLTTENKPRSIQGLKLGKANVGGDHEINVSAKDRSVTLNTYDYLTIWCEPFGVRLGVGRFDN